MESDAGGFTSAAERAYCEYAAQREEERDLEAFCAARPELADELRKLHALVERNEQALPSRSFSARIAERYGSQVDPHVTLAGADDDDERPGGAASGSSSEVLGRLAVRRGAFGRYALKGEIDRGGQGAVVRVWDEDLRRNLAMKVLLGHAQAPSSGAAQPVEPRSLGRFLEEAQVTGQLDHPGIVPVHELGLDPEGRVYFTMKLVKGRTLKTVLELVAERKEGWTQTRALGVLSKVCEAMAYAHHKGVVHRDLKPANVMVGRFGEVFVMDWGLARVLGREDARNVAIAPQAMAEKLHSEHCKRADASPDSPLLTVDGEVVGTPAYMPPEQALGRTEEIGPHSDVYAVGAMLYHLLCGHMPYVEPGMRLSNYDIWYLVQKCPPAPLAARAPETPAELAAICERAMAREIEQRYQSMAELSDDLRAYLEHRVVKAYETGAFAEMRKWVSRNKGLAVAAAVALVATIGGLGGAAWLQQQRRMEVEERNVALGKAKDEVSARKAEFDQLAGKVYLERALAAEKDLYPPWPEKIEALETWLAHDWNRLDALRPTLRKTIADLEGRAEKWTDEDRETDRKTHSDLAKLEALRPLVAALAHAQAIRTGGAKPESVTLPADLAAKSALELNDFAWKRVDPDAAKREFGEEALALAAARAAVAKIEAGDKSAELSATLDTLAWALVANGLDDEAKATEDRALEQVVEDKRRDYEKYRASLGSVIATLTGEAGKKTLADLESSLTALEAEVSKRRTWRFADDVEGESQRFLHETLSRLAADIDALEQHEKASVAERLAWAKKIGDLALHHPKARVTWDEARAAIAKADGLVASTLYRDPPIDLKPQTGLVPIGMNPTSLLWEFYELRSACDLEAGEDPAAIEIPAHRPDGSIEVKNGTGIVFVLIPSGTFVQGAQKEDESKPNFDPGAESDEEPQRVPLAAYFLARHELTKGQWKRLTGGEEPSWYQRGWTYGEDPVAIGWTHPVEQISWTDSDLLMRRHGLSLPTEAQWECGARGGTTTVWWTGGEAQSLSGAANVLDQRGEEIQPGWGRQMGDFDDGFVSQAPVGSYRANAFGLFDVHGNEWEWCGDVYASRYTTPQPADGLRSPNAEGTATRVDRVNRGGNFNNPASHARSAFRNKSDPAIRNFGLGVRPARSITP